MNTIDILDNGELALFIESLRLANYDISTTEFFAAQDLMVALAAQGKLPKTLAPMKTLLMPILCHSPKEQEDFYQHFDQWLNRVENIKYYIKQQLNFLQSVWQDIKQAIKNLKWLFIFALLVLILLSVIPAVIDFEEPIDDSNQIPETPSQQITPTTPIDSTGSPSTILTAPNPNLSDEIKPKDNIDYFTQLYKELTGWQWAMLLLLPFGGLLWYLWQRYKAPPYLIRKSTSQPPDIKQFFAKNINEGIFQSLGMARVAQQLRKHTPIATDSLDLKATIKRTIKAGGWFTPVTGIAKKMPEYLVLIDRTTFKDHHSHLMDALVNQLIAQGIFIARYYFDGDPRHCYPENDELPALLLTELRDHYPTHRLLLFSDGNGFIDPMTGDMVPWIAQFSGWTQKTFFTLAQPEQWGYQEKLLAAANFLVMPANENGLTTLAEKINAEQWLSSTPSPKKATENFTAFPTYFNDFSQWWLERHAPARAKVTELLKQVRDFLGEAGYYWFSACAVYPEIRWHLTVYLGYQLKLLNEEREERFAKLARLPWFRYGNMPNWLRDQLIKDLPLPQENKIRTALKTLLDEASDKPISDFPLEIATSPKSRFSALKQWLSSKWKKQAPKNSLRDYVFLTFMENRLAVKAPKIARMLISKISWQPLFNFISRVANWCKSFVIYLITALSKNIQKFIQKIDWQRFLEVLSIFTLIVAFVLILVFIINSIFSSGNDTNPIHYSEKNSLLSNLLRAASSILWGTSPMNLLIILTFLAINVGVLVMLLNFFLSRSRFKELWQNKSFTRRLLINQFIGLSFLSLIILTSHNIPSLMELEDVSIDFMMELYKWNIPPRKENIPAFVLLDIDNQTNQSWGEVQYTPRDKLKNLIDVAVQAKARLIIVDIDVSYPKPHDQELKEYLEKHVTECKEKQSACSPIILVRAFSEFASGSIPAEPRTSFFDDMVTTESAPYLQWGSAQFVGIGYSNSIRRWRLWEPTCTKERPGITPSIELLVMGMIRGCTEDIQKTLRPFQPKNCDGNGILPPTSVTFCGLIMNTDPLSVQQRVMFRLPWSNDEKTLKYPHVVSENNGVPILTIFSAQHYAESPPQANLERLNDSIVVIGGSYGIGRASDVHPTPIGNMSGALILINAIYTLLQDITIKPVSMWILLAIAIVFITITTVFSYFSFGLWWKLLGLCNIFIIIFGLYYYSIILFENGTWLNIAMPLLIVEIYLNIFKKTFSRSQTEQA